MKVIKNIGASFLVLLALLLAVGMFLPDEYGLERSIVINAPAASIFPQVNDLRNWNNWSPWKQLDPQMKVQYSSDEPVGAEAWYSWQSENSNVGAGKLAILKSQADESIQTAIFFSLDTTNPGNGSWTFETVEGGTKVTWSMKGTASSYFERYFSILMDTMVGSLFEQGLSNLKAVCEAG